MNKSKDQADPSKPPLLSELTETQREAALIKYRLIEPFLNKEMTLNQLCQDKKLSLKTTSTWVSHYRQFGLAGLARKSRTDKGNRRACSTNMNNFLEGLHLKKPHLSNASLYRQARQLAEKNQEALPSYRTVCSIINQIPTPLLTLAQEGRKAYKKQYDLIFIRESHHPNEIWQADHSLLDIVIINDTQKEGVKPWLTIIFDDHSRAIAGYELSLSAPSAIKTALALRHAIWHKEEPHWSICGIPSIFYTDHGSDFTSKHIEQVCIDLKIKLVFSTVGEPQGRGKIERFFLTLNQMLLSELEGYTGAKKGEPTLTLSELNDLMRSFILEYNQRTHSTTKQAPKARWESDGFLPQMPESLEQLDLLLLTMSKTRRVHRDGIHFQALRYLDPVLADYVGVSVIIRYDPADLTSIRVFHKNQYLCQPICHALDRQAVSLKDIQAARTERRKTLHAEMKTRISLVDAILLQSSSTKNRVKPKSKPIKKSKLKLYSHDD